MKNGDLHPNGEWEAVVCEYCNTFLGWDTDKGTIGLFHHDRNCPLMGSKQSAVEAKIRSL